MINGSQSTFFKVLCQLRRIYNEYDIPKLKILKIEEYMDRHAKEIVDFIEQKVSKKSQRKIKIAGKISTES